MTPKKEILKEEETFARFDFILVRSFCTLNLQTCPKGKGKPQARKKILINWPKG